MATDSIDPRRYRQIASDIRGLIASGQIAPGDPAPSITLTDEGLLTRYPGLGYYVTTASPRPGQAGLSTDPERV